MYVVTANEHHHTLKKPFRLNSMAKPSKGISEKFNYGITGINYTKKREYDEYEYDLEEMKLKHNMNEGYKPSFNKNSYLFASPLDDSSEVKDPDDEKLLYLTNKVEELEKKLNSRDLEIKRIKMQNQKLLKDKFAIESKLKKMIKEDKKKDLERKAQQQFNEEEDLDQPPNSEDLQKNLFEMLMRAQTMDNNLQRELEEKEMMEKAIQESLKDNPNPDVMNYEQLQELEERMGFVSKGFSDIEIATIPVKICNSTKDDCSICLEAIKIGEKIKTLSCSHDFHPDCIDECLKTTKKCPCCMDEHQFE